MHHLPAHYQEPLSHPPFGVPSSRLNGNYPRHLPVRKNACIVCCICFSCSGTYGIDCQCAEVQPRRGKNLPEGTLDSRAKKLHRQDKDDYEFTIAWLADSAHNIYKDATGSVAGLGNLTEVSLCKAHSSTLYRAKKRHDRSKNEAPPSPANSNGMDIVMEPARPYAESHPIYPSPGHPHPFHDALPATKATTMATAYAMGESRLAAKAHERSFQLASRVTNSPPPAGFLDFSVVPSTSHKRKRSERHTLARERMPHSSASTPLCGTGMAPLLSRNPPPSSSASAVSPKRPHLNNNSPNFSSQLPPLQTRTFPPSSTLQHQFQFSNTSLPSIYSRRLSDHDRQASPTLEPTSPIVIETVSLKSVPVSPSASPVFHVRNLAITDTFTFRDLLLEIGMEGSPPPGKRIAISDEKNARIYPLDQAIRKVIRHPLSSHVDLCLGLTEKTFVDWSAYQ